MQREEGHLSAAEIGSELHKQFAILPGVFFFSFLSFFNVTLVISRTGLVDWQILEKSLSKILY